jgi:glycosyltransferase involved in cell wall biosynthesis
MKEASFLLFPSECYENFPVTIIEAFATGLPVVASRIGSLSELVADRETGLHFRVSDSADLAAAVDWAFDHGPEMLAIGRRARREFETKYGAEQNYARLRNIYELAAQRCSTQA